MDVAGLKGMMRVRDRDDMRRSVSGLVAIAMQDRWHVGFAATATD